MEIYKSPISWTGTDNWMEHRVTYYSPTTGGHGHVFTSDEHVLDRMLLNKGHVLYPIRDQRLSSDSTLFPVSSLVRQLTQFNEGKMWTDNGDSIWRPQTTIHGLKPSSAFQMSPKYRFIDEGDLPPSRGYSKLYEADIHSFSGRIVGAYRKYGGKQGDYFIVCTRQHRSTFMFPSSMLLPVVPNIEGMTPIEIQLATDIAIKLEQ